MSGTDIHLNSPASKALAYTTCTLQSSPRSLGQRYAFLLRDSS
jgi:hypothetical protein